jgi:preprotein translocase subunit SecG
MLIVSALLALLPIPVILYFVFSKRSGPAVKKAALAALVLALIAMMVNAVLLLAGHPAGIGPGGDLRQENLPLSAGTDFWTLIIMGILLLLFLGFIIVAAIRDQRRSAGRRT